MSRRRKKQEESSGGSPEWLTTYSDLVTLLLCFFVLLFSFSEVDAGKFREIMNSFQGGAGVLEGGTSMDTPLIEVSDDLEEDSGLDDLLNDLELYVDNLGLEDKIIIEVDERGIVVRFMDNVFFDSGSASIKEDSFDILKSVADLLKREEFINRQIKVEGHTDSDDIRFSTKYPTNWELSSARATNVLRYLIEEESMNGRRVSSSGYSYYRPIVENDTPENKAKNRRVDIVILKDEFQELEP